MGHMRSVSQSRQNTTLTNLDSHNSSRLRQRLLQEITNLERELEQLRTRDADRDFSQQQTYREMIHSRRQLLAALPTPMHSQSA